MGMTDKGQPPALNPWCVSATFAPAPDAPQRLLAYCRIIRGILADAGLDREAQFPHEKI